MRWAFVLLLVSGVQWGCGGTQEVLQLSGIPDSASPYVQEVASDRPLAHYRLSGLQDVPGPIVGDADPAMLFDGRRGFELKTPSSWRGASITLEVWARGAQGALLSYATPEAPDAFAFGHTVEGFEAVIMGKRIQTGIALEDDEWHHIALIQDGRVGVLTIAVDGQERWRGPLPHSRPLPEGGQLKIGEARGCSQGECFGSNLKGQLDELALYDRALPLRRAMSRVFVARGLMPATRPVHELPMEFIIQRGHSDLVEQLDVTRDGTLAVSGGWDGRMILWSLNEGRVLRSMGGHVGPVRDVALSLDGRLAASFGCARMGFDEDYDLDNDEGRCLESNIQLWEVDTGALLHSFTCKSQAVGRVRFDAEGHLIASFCLEQPPEEDDERFDDEGFDDEGFDDEGASGGELEEEAPDPALDLGLRVWRVRSGEEVHDMDLRRRAATLLETPRGREIGYSGARTYSKKGRTAPVVVMENDREVASLGEASKLCQDIRFTQRGALILCAHLERAIRVWDASTGRLLADLAGKVDMVTSLSFSPDGERLAVGSYNQGLNLRVWDLANARLGRALKSHGGWVEAVAFSPDGSTLASSGCAEVSPTDKRYCKEGATFVWDPLNWTPQTFNTLNSPDLVYNGSETLFSRQGVGVRRQLLNRGKARWLEPFNDEGGKANVAAIAAGGGRLFVAGWDNEATDPEEEVVLRWFKASNLKPLGALTSTQLWMMNSYPSAMATDRDGVRVVLGSDRGEVAVWNTELQRAEVDPQLKQTRHAEDVRSVAITHDGELVASGDYGGVIHVWSVAEPRQVRRLTGHGGAIEALSFSPDKRLLASASRDGTTRVWDLDSGSVVTLVGSGGQWVIFDDEGHFDASAGGVNFAATVQGTRTANLDQAAVHANRPDLILKSLGMGSPEVLTHLKARYLRRLRKLGLEQRDLKTVSSTPPQAYLRVASPATGADGEVTLDIELVDDSALLSYQVFLNGVPSDEAPLAISGTRARLTKQVTLIDGVNVVEVSALDVDGQESFRARAELEHQDPGRGALTFVGLGVSTYADPELNLNFAHKDALDLGRVFDAVGDYDAVHTHIFTDAEVTPEVVAQINALLAEAHPRDTLVLFIAGHGMHDTDPEATYYYLTHNTQMNDLAGSALSFEAIEAILRKAPHRKKLFLMDTCESGDLDEEVEQAALAVAAPSGLNARGFKRKGDAITLEGSRRRPWLSHNDRFIYTDLTRRSGAIVFSSSRGSEFSYESKVTEQGFFTEALLQAMTTSAGDLNQDGRLTLGELRRYVIRAVGERSKGLQNPVVDRDNIHQSWSFPIHEASQK